MGGRERANLRGGVISAVPKKKGSVADYFSGKGRMKRGAEEPKNAGDRKRLPTSAKKSSEKNR